MKADELRAVFLDYFKGKGHTLHPPASLIPENDRSLLFTGAGMNQFKNLFFGGEAGKAGNLSRAATCQRCFRANDIEIVGQTSRHLTFLEMLGNFSFGDYFKEEAISRAWEFLNQKLRIPSGKTLITVYEQDEETHGIWTSAIGIPPERIFRLGAEDNFWEMGKTGPCGPCTEIIIDMGGGCGSKNCGPLCDCGRHVELWNLVFTQFNREEDGTLKPLPQNNIDTGMGLERLSAVMQGVPTVFETDTIKPLVTAVKDRAGPMDDAGARVIADHARALVFCISDGILPSNEGRGYVVRKLARRAMEKLASRDAHGMLEELVPLVCGLMKAYYPHLETQSGQIKSVLAGETARFRSVFEKLPDLEDDIRKLRKKGAASLDGETYFKYYDTYGIPRDTIKSTAASHGLSVDEEGFNRALDRQRSQSRSGSSFRLDLGGAAAAGEETVFSGYDELETEGKVVALLKDNIRAEEAAAGEKACIITDRSCFYPESGGQEGDSGEIKGGGWTFSVSDTAEQNGLIVHRGTVSDGRIKPGDRCSLAVNQLKRSAAAANHTATHLLQFSLRAVLGEHVRQAGSMVSRERLRFDFSHPAALTEKQVAEIEDMVNGLIRENLPVETEIMPPAEAIAAGATALFGEKYGDEARVIRIGGRSIELCGGTHRKRTGEIGVFIIVSETSIAAGTRRIEAVTGGEAIKRIRQQKQLISGTAEFLKSAPEEILSRTRALMESFKNAQKQIEALKAEKTASRTEEIIAEAEKVEDIRVISRTEEGLSPEGLSRLADTLKEKSPSTVSVLASRAGGGIHFVAVLSPDLAGRGLDAGRIVKQVAAITGGGGGGRADFAKAGGRHPGKLAEAMSRVVPIVKDMLADGGKGGKT